MNSSNEHYKNDPSKKSGPPNRRIDDALIEFLSGEITDITDMHNDSLEMPLQTSSRSRDSKCEFSDRICQATKNGGTEGNWRKSWRGG